MAEVFGTDSESLRVEIEEIGRSLRSSFQRHTSSRRQSSSSSSTKEADINDDYVDAEQVRQWAAIERLPIVKRLRSALVASIPDDEEEEEGNALGTNGKQVIDVTKLGKVQRHVLIGRLIKDIQNDNLRLLRKFTDRLNKVGVHLPTVDVRYKNLIVEAECEVVHGKPIPTIWNSIKSSLSGLTKLPGARSRKVKVTILDDVSGIIKPGRMALLLGPPGCGKTTLFKALSGNLNKSISGEISYNGYNLDEFVPQKTSAYISQNDLQFPEMTVRETLDFSARCQGVGYRSEMMMEVSEREKEAGIIPDTDIDAYMKAISVKGQERTLRTDYFLKILELESCADTQVGDALRRGISGGQKRRLTTGEITVGPNRALFMDEITNGLDSSTSFQVVSCLQQLAHITNATILITLLQPTPETYDLFDGLILMSDGKIVYHGPRDKVLEFFEDCGFRCPMRKAVADFVQEVLSREHQELYWHHTEVAYSYVSADMFRNKFKESPLGKKIEEELSVPFDKSKNQKNDISFSPYSVSKWQLFNACMSRELLLLKRNSSVIVFKTIQLVILGLITMTVFLRSWMDVNVRDGAFYMGSLFFSLIILIVDALPEVSMTVSRLPVFHKQKSLCFYPAWAYAIPNCIIKIPLSFWQSLIWTCLTYYVIGYAPEVERIFKQFLLFAGLHLAASSIFRFLGSVFQTNVLAMTASISTLLLILLFGGFVITHPSMPSWLKWAFWASPMTYAEIGLSLNEFLAPRWQLLSGNTTIGQQILESRGLYFHGYMYWASVIALLGFTLLFNIAFTLALTFVKAPNSSQALISSKRLPSVHGSQGGSVDTNEEQKAESSATDTHEGRMLLPFTPLALTFEDVQYNVDTPLEMRAQGFPGRKLQLLADITGTFRPGVLTALMGVSGAGKTTLLDVLSGRKTSGYIKGQIKVGGYPKVQETFARISGYCEQTDIHTPQITVEESLMFSAWLRLPPEIDRKSKSAFVKEVLEAIELNGVKDVLVGAPGVNGLSNEQRKRLTIAVELVANPPIIFMDEPTTGLDARSAETVMRVVKNAADTGRTVVCTIHQPSTDIFETFDELILIKSGGRVIYYGPLGQNSCSVIKYFEAIPGVPKIRNNYNPATWMFEVTSPSVEAELGVDFAKIYKESALYRRNKELVQEFNVPPPDSKELHFPTQYSESSWGQFKCCLWKQHLSYWRSPSYNLTRVMYTVVTSLIFGLAFWNQAKDIKKQQDLLTVLGSLYSIILYMGIYTCSTTLPYIAAERTVMNRERFAGMYSLWSYPLAQVVIEVPYLLTQAIIVLAITYPMIGYQGSAGQVFFYFYAMFCSLLFFKCLGMLLVSITPNVTIAAILTSACYPMFNLFSGYLLPRPKIPKWWIWLYYLAPTSWSLNGLFTSQFGEVQTYTVAFGETKTVAAFLSDYLGYQHAFLPVVAVVLILYPLLLAFLFAFCIGRLNYQKR